VNLCLLTLPTRTLTLDYSHCWPQSQRLMFITNKVINVRKVTGQLFKRFHIATKALEYIHFTVRRYFTKYELSALKQLKKIWHFHLVYLRQCLYKPFSVIDLYSCLAGFNIPTHLHSVSYKWGNYY